MEDTEKNLRDELESAQTALDISRSHGSDESVGNSKTIVETGDDIESSKKAILDKLEKRKRELVGCTSLLILQFFRVLFYFQSLCALVLSFYYSLVAQKLIYRLRVQWKQ